MYCTSNYFFTQETINKAEFVMDALYNKSGEVHAWLDAMTGNICGLDGQYVAFVCNDSVYDRHGCHIGWWSDGCIRDCHGAAAYFTRYAGPIGMLKPQRRMKPLEPLRRPAPLRPPLSVKPQRPTTLPKWSQEPPV
jgi:hypothetical protein